jgi:hypothetical protein
MRVGLRWPHGPFQVTCVLVAVLPTVALSPQFGFAGCGGARLRPDSSNLGSLSERFNANAIAMVLDHLNATHLTVFFDLSAVLDDGDKSRAAGDRRERSISKFATPASSRVSSQHNAVIPTTFRQ